MKAICDLPKCVVLNKQVNAADPSKNMPEWYQVLFMQGMNTNCITCDKETFAKLELQKEYTLELTVSEVVQNKYVQSKFKITGLRK